MNHSSMKADGGFFALQRADQTSHNSICLSREHVRMVHWSRGIFKVMVNKNLLFLFHFILPPIYPISLFSLLTAFIILTCSYLSSVLHFPTTLWSFFAFIFSTQPYILTLLPNTPSTPHSASDIASDQGQVLVIVTAAVGGFTLLVILTLFLLITGR